MIVGTGIDIVDVSRIREKVQRVGFREKVFSGNEISYCEKASDPYPLYAGRFAAKEAFLKATGMGLTLSYDLHEIEVQHGIHGEPVLRLSGNVARVASENGWNRLFVSLSHIDHTACAVVIIER